MSQKSPAAGGRKKQQTESSKRRVRQKAKSGFAGKPDSGTFNYFELGKTGSITPEERAKLRSQIVTSRAKSLSGYVTMTSQNRISTWGGRRFPFYAFFWKRGHEAVGRAAYYG